MVGLVKLVFLQTLQNHLSVIADQIQRVKLHHDLVQLLLLIRRIQINQIQLDTHPR